MWENENGAYWLQWRLCKVWRNKNIYVHLRISYKLPTKMFQSVREMGRFGTVERDFALWVTHETNDTRFSLAGSLWIPHWTNDTAIGWRFSLPMQQKYKLHARARFKAALLTEKLTPSDHPLPPRAISCACLDWAEMLSNTVEQFQTREFFFSVVALGVLYVGEHCNCCWTLTSKYLKYLETW